MFAKDIEAAIGKCNAHLVDLAKKLKEQHYVTKELASEVAIMEAEFELMEAERASVKAADMVDLDLWRKIAEVMDHHTSILEVKRVNWMASVGTENRFKVEAKAVESMREEARKMLAKADKNVLQMKHGRQ